MAIKVDNIFFSYLKKSPMKVDALNGVSMEINNGDFIGVVGETGSGKTTLVQMLNALLLPDEGSIKVDEYLVTNKKNKKNRTLRKHVGLVFQFPEYQLFEETVLKDVCYGPLNFGASNEEANEIAKKALQSVGIGEEYYNRSPFDLSGGEKRRIAIAGIIAMNPEILVLDEPTVGLDPDGAKEIMTLIRSFNKDGKTIILVSHEMEIVTRFCNKVFYIDNGKITFEGAPYELFSKTNYSFEMPQLIEFALSLNQAGFDIDISKLHSYDDIFIFIEENIKNERN